MTPAEKQAAVANLRASIVRRVDELDDEEDLRVLSRILDELPGARLVATCEAETDALVEGDEPIKVPNTSALVYARSSLLGAWDAFRVVVGLRKRVPRGVHLALRRSRAARP